MDGDHVKNERLLFFILIVNTLATVVTPAAFVLDAIFR